MLACPKCSAEVFASEKRRKVCGNDDFAVSLPTVPGFLTLYPSGITRPVVSVINYSAAQTRANNAVVTPGATGSLAVFAGQASGTVHVIIDVNGYFE